MLNHHRRYLLYSIIPHTKRMAIAKSYVRAKSVMAARPTSNNDPKTHLSNVKFHSHEWKSLSKSSQGDLGSENVPDISVPGSLNFIIVPTMLGYMLYTVSITRANGFTMFRSCWTIAYMAAISLRNDKGLVWKSSSTSVKTQRTTLKFNRITDKWCEITSMSLDHNAMLILTSKTFKLSSPSPPIATA